MCKTRLEVEGQGIDRACRVGFIFMEAMVCDDCLAKQRIGVDRMCGYVCDKER